MEFSVELDRGMGFWRVLAYERGRDVGVILAGPMTLNEALSYAKMRIKAYNRVFQRKNATLRIYALRNKLRP